MATTEVTEGPKGLTMTGDSAMFKWIVPNYRNQYSQDNYQSKCFTFPINEDLTFCPKLESDERYSNNINFQLIIETKYKEYSNYNWIMLTMSVSCLNDLNQKVFTHTRKCSKLAKNCINLVTLDKYDLHKYLVKDDLILLYEIKLCGQPHIENLQLTEEHESFIVDKHFRDVNLLIGDKTIHAHKGILANKSPVFTAMLTTEMKESITSEVKITSFDYDVFLEVLRFMYTGKIEKKDQLAFEILKAAHFYQINDLIIICEHPLSKSINVENAIKILKLADECGAKMLLNSCFTFIIQHLKSFQKSSELEDLIKKHPHLIMQLMKPLSIA